LITPMRCPAIACLCLAAASGLAALPARQEFATGVRDPSHAFLTDAEEEARHGTYLTYTQNYRDKRKESVSLRGSVYGVLRDVKANGCDVEARVEIYDHFSGSIRGIPTGEVQDKSEYAIHFRLTREIAAALDVLQGRPTQLAHAMHTQCQEDASCAFTWLRIRSARPVLYEQIVLNDSITFDGPANQILAPVSSRESANGLIRDLQALAAAQCQ
jgi:hypothetical protein